MSVRLEQLLANATPGPWGFNDSTDSSGHKGEFRARSPYNGFMLVGPWVNDADPALIAKTPDMARLLIDMGETLREIEFWNDGFCACCGIAHAHDSGCEYAALLARLDALGKEQA